MCRRHHIPAIALIALFGCSREAPTYRVTGSVTWNGEPIPNEPTTAGKKIPIFDLRRFAF